MAILFLLFSIPIYSCIIVSLCMVVILLFGYILYLLRKRKNDLNSIMNNAKIIETNRQQNMKLQISFDHLKKKYSVTCEEIENAQNQINDLLAELDVLKTSIVCPDSENMPALLDKAIVKKFFMMARDNQKASESQWQLLEKVFECDFPEFRIRLENHGQLTERGLRICMLIRLGFKPSELCSLLGMSKSNMSNRKRMATKIFGEEMSSRKFDANIRNIGIPD